MDKPLSVVAVVVTYNRVDLLLKNIDCLLSQSSPCDILIVDNASQDDTEKKVNLICAENERVHYVNTGKNLGGAGGFNFGIKKACQMGYSHFWLMDDDCMPEKIALQKLLEAHECIGTGNYGYLSSAVLWQDGRECVMNRQKVKKSYFENVHLLEKGIIEVEQSTFVSVLIPRETVKKVGLPIKEFFIWGDDIEYTRRITVRNKMPSFLAGQSRVFHAMRENNGSSIALDNPQRISRYVYAFRNEAYLYRKEGIKGLCYYFAKCALNFLRILFKAKGKRIRRFLALFLGMIKGMLFFPKTEFVNFSDKSE